MQYFVVFYPGFQETVSSVGGKEFAHAAGGLQVHLCGELRGTPDFTKIIPGPRRVSPGVRALLTNKGIWLNRQLHSPSPFLFLPLF